MPNPLAEVERRYPVRISPAMQALIDHPHIAAQFLPHESELITAPHERADPIGDDTHSPVKGIVHRYPDRALLKPLLICPVYCRFCFRRETVGPDSGLLSDAELQTALAWIEAHPQIGEIILTGGDPLMLSPRRLAHIIQTLDRIPHIHTIRLHSRVPTTDPGRITPDLLDALAAETPVWLAVHANTAAEFTPQARAALLALSRRAIPLLGQTVLLRGINDTPETLESLLRAMLAARVKPYYLHQLDPAPGTARFHVPIAEGQNLLAQLRGRVTGLAWPTYVLDIEGGHGKVPLMPSYASKTHVTDPNGTPHKLAAPDTSA